jgi:hypothetical protein
MVKHSNESLAFFFLIVASIRIYGCVGIKIIHCSIVRFAFVFKLKGVFGQQTGL